MTATETMYTQVLLGVTFLVLSANSAVVQLDVCKLPLVTGPCRAAFPKWGHQNGECVQFTYGGCKGNDNRFATKEACEQRCPPVDTCELPLVTGPCRAAFPKWGHQNGQCVGFIYGGCQGNDNRFDTKEECEASCPTTTDICSLPLERGICMALIPSWGAVNGKCQRFFYGGCEGNENRFYFQSECEARCES